VAKEITIRDRLLRSFSALVGDAIKHCTRSEEVINNETLNIIYNRVSVFLLW
jgi:hypothetical protein